MGDESWFPNPFLQKARDEAHRYKPLTARERLQLERAPRRPSRGTRVTVGAYDIPALPGQAEHMFVEYDDGNEQLIARGGPSEQGPAFLGGVVGDSLRVKGEVTPAQRSRDYGAGQRVLFRGFAPGLSAQMAAEPARRVARELEQRPRRYGRDANSNSYVADVVEPLFGVRPGDDKTPGYRQRLDQTPPPRPIDLSPALRGPPY